MAEGCGVGRGLAVLAGVVGAVCVPAGVVVVLFMAVDVGLSVAVVCLRARVLGPALRVLLAAEVVVVAAAPWLLAVSWFREVLVAAAMVPVVTCDLLPCLVEGTEGVVVFFPAAVTEGIAGVVAVLGPSVAAVDTVPAPAWAALGWPGADVAWSCSLVCSVVLCLTGAV